MSLQVYSAPSYDELVNELKAARTNIIYMQDLFDEKIKNYEKFMCNFIMEHNAILKDNETKFDIEKKQLISFIDVLAKSSELKLHEIQDQQKMTEVFVKSLLSLHVELIKEKK